ncbi:MAG: tRNA (adenosine(37)-N6)-threonylcarbamoyltransferase complex ATPase subunit type 1 TsaE [Ruminococcaceae bacterium]|nr:tRNA (adenosine(37)-N6)-threonylcarbamoyltransferase complex ATPase subunit type 1 TsaE [Oscillospiraceae bacterium]
MSVVYKTASERETRLFAREFASKLQGGDVLCLHGELGVGKTVFAQGLCEALGVTEPVNSPTFTLVNEYEGSTLTIYHFDLYRIVDADELYEIGFEEMVASGGVTLIEWAERAGGLLPKQRTDIRIERDGENGRRITIEEKTL